MRTPAAGPSLRAVEGQRLQKLLGGDMVLVSPERTPTERQRVAFDAAEQEASTREPAHVVGAHDDAREIPDRIRHASLEPEDVPFGGRARPARSPSHRLDVCPTPKAFAPLLILAPFTLWIRDQVHTLPARTEWYHRPSPRNEQDRRETNRQEARSTQDTRAKGR